MPTPRTFFKSFNESDKTKWVKNVVKNGALQKL